MYAVMLAAGDGIRCRPFTHLSPKISQGVCGIPLLEYMLSWFGGSSEIHKLYIAARGDSTVSALRRYLSQRMLHLPEILDLWKWLGFRVENVNPDLEIEAVETKGWGTGGDLRLVINHMISSGEFEGDLLVCNADYVVARRLPDGSLSPQLNLSDIVRHHQACTRTNKTVMTVCLVPVNREEATRFGVALLEGVGQFSLIRGFAEKPKLEDIAGRPWINAGVYVLDGGFLGSRLDELLPQEPRTSLEKTLLETLAKEDGSKLASYQLELEAWFDVGTLQDLVRSNVYIASAGRGRR